MSKDTNKNKNNTLVGTTDNVNHPNHYCGSGNIECIDAIKECVVDLHGIASLCIGNVLKYIWRFSRKNGLEDLQKARWYLDRAIKEIYGEESKDES